MTELIEKLSLHSGMSKREVRRICLHAPERYAVYPIEKKSSKATEPRIIAQPRTEVKYLQYVIKELLLDNLPIHQSATAYRKGMSLVDNVNPHAGFNQILKMDFKDFFNSITASDWKSYCHENLSLNDEDIDLSARLLFWRKKGGRSLRLSVGAPTSPILSNIMMYNFDMAICQYIENEKITYTRYADDLTFSASRTGYLVDVKGYVRKAIKSISYPKNIKINHEKTSYYTTKHRRSVTGLVLSNDGRVTVGRDRKRQVFVGIYKYSRGELDIKQSMELAGHLGFILSVEPDFLYSVCRRYGVDVVKTLQRLPNENRIQICS